MKNTKETEYKSIRFIMTIISIFIFIVSIIAYFMYDDPRKLALGFLFVIIIHLLVYLFEKIFRYYDKKLEGKNEKHL